MSATTAGLVLYQEAKPDTTKEDEVTLVLQRRAQIASCPDPTIVSTDTKHTPSMSAFPQPSQVLVTLRLGV